MSDTTCPLCGAPVNIARRSGIAIPTNATELGPYLDVACINEDCRLRASPLMWEQLWKLQAGRAVVNTAPPD
jgi:hypothetical protein